MKNDWWSYLAHSESRSKYKGGFINGKNSSAYNHDYYIRNKDKWKTKGSAPDFGEEVQPLGNGEYIPGADFAGRFSDGTLIFHKDGKWYTSAPGDSLSIQEVGVNKPKSTAKHDRTHNNDAKATDAAIQQGLIGENDKLTNSGSGWKVQRCHDSEEAVKEYRKKSKTRR